MKAERVEQNEDGVTAWLKSSDSGGKEREVRCKYIVECDGAHSIVRKSAGIKYEGSVYPQDFILAGVHMKWSQKDCLSVFVGDGFMGSFLMKYMLFRFIISRPQERYNDVGSTMKDFENMIRKLVTGKAEIFDPTWITK